MFEEYDKRPLYMRVADWVMMENRWVSAKEIAKQFDIDHCKAINTVSYILSEVGEIVCETKSIPNQLEGRGCQCQRLVRIIYIAPQLYTRRGNSAQNTTLGSMKTPRVSAEPPEELDFQQKWKMMLSKSRRR